MNTPTHMSSATADRRETSSTAATALVGTTPAGDDIEGTRPAFNAIYQRYAHLLFSFFYRYVRHRQDAEDLTAVTFSKVLGSIERYTDQGCFEAWLWSIARHTLYDAQRRSRELVDIELVAFRLADPAPSPEAEILQAEQADQLRQLLRELPADQQHVLMLRFFREWGFNEIARSLNRSVGAVKMLAQRALSTLRTHYPQLEHPQLDSATDSAHSTHDSQTTMTFRLQGATAAVICFMMQFWRHVPQPQPLLTLQPAVVADRRHGMYATQRRLR